MKQKTQSLLTKSHTPSEKNALELFTSAYRRVPAYKDFLKKHGVDGRKITSYYDFQTNVPLMDKQNYISQYSLADLCFDGNIFTGNIISSSSGSTGTPFFWPRGVAQDLVDTQLVSEIFSNFLMNEKNTLFIVCLSLGTWIAGSIMTMSGTNYANEGNPVSVITPGIEKSTIIDVIKRLSGNYEQIVMVAYPPFVKDVIEEGIRADVDWEALSVKLILGGEAYSEEWRDYILELLGSSDPFFGTANIFGAADIGIVGYETPLSILLRRLYNQHPTEAEQLFGSNTLPSLIQYDPLERHFEKVKDELIITSNSGIPLVRYNLKDTGGLLSLDQMTNPLRHVALSEAKKLGMELMTEKPFVFLNGRKDFAISIYSVNVYPENIKAALIDSRLRQLVTGRFTMATSKDEDMNDVFGINIELAKDTIANIEDEKFIERVIHEKLTHLNSEYHKLSKVVGDKARPTISLVAYGNTEYFARGIKHRWTRKED